MAVEVSSADGFVRMSINRLAREFGMDRQTVARRLREASVSPDGSRLGHPVFRLRDAAPVICGRLFNEAGELDPLRMPPEKRNAWYQSESRRMDVEMRAGELVPLSQVRDEMAGLVMGLMQFLETLPDVLERDCGLSPEQVDNVADGLRKQREALYTQMTEDAEPVAATNGNSNG